MGGKNYMASSGDHQIDLPSLANSSEGEDEIACPVDAPGGWGKRGSLISREPPSPFLHHAGGIEKESGMAATPHGTHQRTPRIREAKDGIEVAQCIAEQPMENPRRSGGPYCKPAREKGKILPAEGSADQKHMVALEEPLFQGLLRDHTTHGLGHYEIIMRPAELLVEKDSSGIR